MARNSAEACNMRDQNIPQWKRELLIRRRALGRTLQVGSSSVKLTCPAVVTVVRQPEIFGQCENVASTYQAGDELVSTSSSYLNQTQVEDSQPSPNLSTGCVGEPACNMRLLDTNCVVLNGGDVRNKQSDMCVSQNIIVVEDKKGNLKKKSATSRARVKLTQNPTPSINSKNTVGSDKTNGSLSKDDDCLSDSSEELQYGPGIVNRLKTKYLSMTLREQKKHSRPSIINLRRATSLENMLEVDGNINNLENKSSDTTTTKTENKPSKGNNKTTFVSKSVGPNSNRVMKYLGHRSSETMKRARSMDTLLKTDLGHNTFKENIVPTNKNKYVSKEDPTKTLKPIVSIVNENIIIVENLPARSDNTKTDFPCDIVQNSSSNCQIVRSSSCDSQDRELPPPDLVKQTLKIFEPSSKRKTKASNGGLSKLVAGFSTVSSQSSTSRSVNNRSVEKMKMSPNKPSISPKPVISPEKLRQHRSRVGSPKKNPISPNPQMDSKPVLLENNSPTRLNNMNSLICQTSTDSSEVNKSRSPIIDDDSPLIASSNSCSINSPIPSLSNAFKTNNEHSLPNSLQRKSLSNISTDEEKDDNLNEYNESDRPSIESSKPVLESALENIRRGGFSVQFSFNNESSQNKSVPKTYLPISRTPPQALNSSLLKQKLESSTPIAPLRTSSSPTGTKQIGIIRPLVSTKNQSSPPILTDQEIEKNLINRVKSIEQPISKVVVAVKTLPDNVVLGSVSDSVINKNSSLPRVSNTSKSKSQGLWDEEKIWQSNQNTIVFNFSDRKEVPDYIENDGLILRGKREKPRVSQMFFTYLTLIKLNSGKEIYMKL